MLPRNGVDGKWTRLKLTTQLLDVSPCHVVESYQRSDVHEDEHCVVFELGAIDQMDDGVEQHALLKRQPRKLCLVARPVGCMHYDVRLY